MQPLSPNKLGRYEVVDELGKGAMGVVYLARDPLIGRLVALKTFRIGYSVRDAELEQFRARFIREAQSAGILSHPNIVTIHDVVERGDEGVAFIAMEYVRGTNLKAVLQEPQRPTLPYVVEVLTQIADGLDYAHSCKVVHRDIKPANILITGDSRAKITDFGIARLDTSNLTQEGQLLGTPNYMSPEQILGRDVDHRADIFSLGVVLYEMITRHKPFQGENLTMVSHRIVYDQFTPVRDYVDDLPPGTEQILAKALEKDPNRRYQRARDMADDLRRVVGSVGRRDLLNETQSLSSTAALPAHAFVPPAPPVPAGVSAAVPAGGAAGSPGAAPPPPAQSSAAPAAAAAGPAAAAPAAAGGRRLSFWKRGAGRDKAAKPAAAAVAPAHQAAPPAGTGGGDTTAGALTGGAVLASVGALGTVDAMGSLGAGGARLAELPTAPLPGRALAAAGSGGAAASTFAPAAPAVATASAAGGPPAAGAMGVAAVAAPAAGQPEYRHATRPVEQPADLSRSPVPGLPLASPAGLDGAPPYGAAAASGAPVPGGQPGAGSAPAAPAAPTPHYSGAAAAALPPGVLATPAALAAPAGQRVHAAAPLAVPAAPATPPAPATVAPPAAPAGGPAPAGAAPLSPAAPVASPARRGFFGLPSVAGLAVAVAVGLALGLLLVGGWLLWARTAQPPARAAARDRAVDGMRAQVVDLLHDARRRLDAGDAAGAALMLRAAEGLVPGSRAVRTLRSGAERQEGDQARRVDQERLIGDKLNEARLALTDRRFDDAEAAANAVMAASPGNTAATDILTAVKQGRLHAKDRQAASARQQQAAVAPPVAPVAPPVAARPAPAPAPAAEARDATLELAFFSELPQGSLLIYVNDAKVAQESFHFYEKGGLFRSRPKSGWVRRSVHLPAGNAQIRVYVTPQGNAAVVRTLSGNFPGGASRRLDVKLDASGQVTAELQ